MMIVYPIVALGLLGAIAGLLVAAVAASYAVDRGFWPWPRGHACAYGASSRLHRTSARSLSDRRQARHGHGHASKPRLL